MRRPSDRDRDRDKDWEREREKDKDRYRERDRVRYYDLRHERESERRNDRDREKSRDIRSDSGNFYNSNSNYYEQGRDNLNRDEDEQDDFEERIVLKLAEQEEEDLNRIKEESRKQREAILKKYRNQQLQQQNKFQSEDADRDKELIEGSGQSTTADNVASETVDGRTDGADVYVAERLFSVGKSPSQNGIQAPERTSGAVGLREGSPKKCPSVL